MSAFLGPIHNWLFKKIVNMEKRAFAIASTMQNNGKADIAESKIKEYGQKLEGADLAALVGDSSIHQSLYGLISKVEVFEASLVAEAGDGFEKIIQAVEDHGRKSGELAVAEQGDGPADLAAINKYVNDNQLEGMPCDPGAEVAPLDENRTAYRHTACNHIPNWQYTDCPPSKLCAVHNAWLKGFISGLNPSATYSVEKTIADGASSCSAEIKLLK